LILRSLLVCLSLGATAACEFPITEETESAWQRNFSQALLPGYRSFKGLHVDSDVGLYIFRYEIGSDIAPGQVVEALRARIAGRSACYRVVIESTTELQMRCATGSGDAAGFDEFRFLYDPKKQRVTVMVGNFDSPAEQDGYRYLFEEMRRLHTS